MQMFARELCVWARLEHENILALIGIVTVEGMPALASEWMENGTMNDYLKAHVDVNVLNVVRATFIYRECVRILDTCAQVQGVASGLEYLHEQGIVHSDLKGVSTFFSFLDHGSPKFRDSKDNVLIGRDGRAVLSDFGISRLMINSVTIAGTKSIKGNMRWMAPELILPGEEPQHSCHTKATDVWAFGMVAYVSGNDCLCNAQ
jgi:serine/threonine protein kinase